jgi:hypothetical protein
MRPGFADVVSRALVGGVLVLSACSGSSGGAAPTRTDGGADAGLPTPAAKAFVWGYPLVVTRRTLQTLGALVGTNSLYDQTAPSGVATRTIVSPNVDTLYSVAVLDLRSEPMVLTVPDVTDRYWTYQFLDAWTDSFFYVGTRATAGKGGTFVITPPGWSGTVPAGAQRVASPTPQAFLLGRYLYRDATDVANVVALSRTLVGLHTLTGATSPAPPPALGSPPGTPQQVGSDGAPFFDELGDTLSIDGPASTADMAALAGFASLGIGPGLHPAARAIAASDTTSLDALAAGVKQGMAEMAAEESMTSGKGSAWTVRLDVGTYTDPLVRAAIAQVAWGANVPAEAVYALSAIDSAGNPYSGAKRYVVHFAQPPAVGVQGFWSLTMYGPDRFFVANSLDRYAVGDRTAGFVTSADGSFDVYVQNTSPAGHEANWLPAPSGAFQMILRLYLPQAPVLAGTYTYPTVTAGP